MARLKDAAEAALRKRIGAEIRRRMKAAHKTPSDVARAAVLDDSQVSKVLAGRVGLSFTSLARVAAALGCTSADILTAVENKRPAKASKKRGSDVLDHGGSLAPGDPRT